VVNNVRYRCEVGHRLHKQYTSLAQQATLHHALAQARSSPSTASLSGASSGYAAGYAAGCASYGNAAAYYPQHPAPQYQHQAQGYPTHAPAPAEGQQQHACYVYSSPAQQCSSPATTDLYSPGTTSFTPTPMASQGIYGSRSPTAYDLQMLALQSPQVHVVTPQRVYANPRMAVSAAQQAGYLSGALVARPLGAAHLFQPQQVGQYVPQPQYTSQAQYVSQPQYVPQPQYSCQYMVPSAVTSPTQDYPEMGLRARSYTEGSDPGCNANMYMSAPQQQHAGYIAASSHFSGTAMVASSPPTAPQMLQYYMAQQQPAVQAPHVVYQYVTAPAVPVSATSAAPAVSQEEGEDREEQSPRSSVCMSCSSNEHLGMRPRANSGLAPPPSPVCEKARLLRFPQVGYAAHPAVVYVTPPGSARDAHQYVQSQCVYQDQQLDCDAGAMTVSPTL
jgi:hypothetical protein